jgi:hypothetical protein
LKRQTGLFLAIFCGSVLGCIPAQEGRVIRAPEIQAPSGPLLPEDLLDRRIDFLNTTLDKDTLSEEDRQVASDLLATYTSAKSAARAELNEPEYRQLVYDLMSALVRIDEYYFSRVEIARDQSKAVSQFMKKRRKILEAHLSRDEQGVINHCLEIQAAFGPDALTPEIAVLFALSLAKKGMRKEAMHIIEGIVPEIDESPDPNRLRIRIAELQLRMGQRGKALETQKKLAEKLDEQQTALEALEKRIASAETESLEPIETTFAQSPRDLHAETESAGATEQLIQKVDELIAERKYGEAWDLLISNQGMAGSDAEKSAIDHALKRLEAAQEEYLEKTISMISKKKETLAMARRYLDAEKYEEAISNLESFPEGEASLEVRELREQAVEGLINRERNRAARIFLNARRTQDPVKKKAYLVACHEILSSLLARYPSSPLSEKIRSHIQKVTEEMEKPPRGAS